MKTVPLTQGKFALVDDEDYDFLMQWKWGAQKHGHTFYARQSAHRGSLSMHSLLIEAPVGYEIDHRDRDGLNNQKSNLRVATRSQNNRNRSKTTKQCTSVFKGVRWDQGKWDARVTIEGKPVYIGRFDQEHHAALAYDLWATDLYAEFAQTNFKKASL